VTYSDGEAFLSGPPKASKACLLLDANLPGMSGFDLLRSLSRLKIHMPTIMFTGEGDIKLAVQAMQAGAFDFIEKPVGRARLLAAVSRALAQSKDSENAHELQQRAALQIASLTVRQRQIMDLVLAGTASKNIAADLGISQRTVEKHRAAIMEKTGTKSTPALARLAMLGGRHADAADS
jgi:two-component system CheB/CheR fusion protein